MNVNVTTPGPSWKSEDDEQNVFLLGNSDDEDKSLKQDTKLWDVPPPYTGTSETRTIAAVYEKVASDSIDGETANKEGWNSSKYYIQPGDSLQDIALRYGIDVSVQKVILVQLDLYLGPKVWQLNSLPFSTLSTALHHQGHLGFGHQHNIIK